MAKLDVKRTRTHDTEQRDRDRSEQNLAIKGLYANELLSSEIQHIPKIRVYGPFIFVLVCVVVVVQVSVQ